MLPYRAIAACILVLSTAAPALASAQETAGLAPPVRARVDSIFASYDKPDVPGCALGVFQNGRAAYARGYGAADLERHVPITSATLFDVGSTSKQFAAASLILLAEDGKLSLSDNVRKYIPELPDYGAPITIDHLLRHTSGLRDYAGLLALAGYSLEEVTTDSEALAIIVHQRHLNFPTGTRFSYSNTGYFLASVIVRRVSGKPLADFARERIFLPLGMTHTVYRNKAAMLIPGRALGYAPGDSNRFRNSMSNWEQTGDGAVHLSVDDALAWDENFYHPRVGGPTLVAQLQARGTLSNGDSIDYARGLFIDHYRGLRRVQHGGDWIGYHAAFERFPDQHTSVVTLCNSDGIDPSALADRVADVVLGDAFPEKPHPSPAPTTTASVSGTGRTLAPSQVVGSYFEATDQDLAQVQQKDGSLVLRISGAQFPLTASGPSTFAVTGVPATVEFLLDAHGAARALRLRVETEDRPEAVLFTPVVPTAAERQQYVGSYYSPELDVTWSVVQEHGRLMLTGFKASSLVDLSGELEPAMRDAFGVNNGGAYIRFTRDARGRVTGFGLSASRMRDIRFTRVGNPPARH
jgi:CubicO group peptidase (beta-lactamase class C family)